MKFNVKHRECLRNHPSQRLMIKCLTIPDRIGIWEWWFLRRGENWTTRRKTSRSREDYQQQTQPTYDSGSGNRTRVTLVGGERSHHCAIPAPQIESLSPQYRHSSFVLMPNMNSSFLVISTILWIRLILNSFNIVSLQTFFSDLKILVPESCIERFSLQRLGPVWSWLGIWKKNWTVYKSLLTLPCQN